MKVTPDSELEHLKDEDYLIFRAKEEEASNPFSGKSWLITAQTIFPKNFSIQFEIYKIAKKEKHVNEAANCLAILFQNFCNEPSLWVEIDAIMTVLSEPSCQGLSQPPFISQIFYSLSKETQKAIILTAAERSKDTMTYVSLMLLLTSSFPENAAYNGCTLVDALMKAEKHTTHPLNPYRRKLVCELLPRLLEAEGLEMRPKTLHLLLTKSIEFYVAYSTTALKLAQVKLDTNAVIEDPWQELFSIVRLIGWNFGWEMATEFDTVSNRELILQKIQNMVESGARLGGGDNGEDVREILFVTITLFLHALLDYTRRLHPDFIQGETANSFPHSLTLVEAFTKLDRDDGIIGGSGGTPGPSSKVLFSPPTPKRLRPSIEEEQTPAIITVSRLAHSLTGPGGEPGVGAMSSSPLTFASGAFPQSSVTSGAISQALITAIKCWNLLHAYESLRTEFVRILDGLNIAKWLVIFNMDVLIYEGRLVEAENQLRHTLTKARQSLQSTSSMLSILSINLKLASVLFALNKFSAATESALEVVDQLSPLSSHGGLTPNLVVSTTSHRRHLHLLALTQSQCLQFITTLLIHSLRHLIIVEGNTDDLCLGHLIILLQFEWPRYLHVFEEVIEVIRKKGGFAYQYFAPYVTTSDILEEFMFLANSLGAGFQLDILPMPHSSKQQRMSTRGADRGSKQDFKSAMKKQMLRCPESVETNLISFLTRQGAYIPHVFM